MGHVGPLVEEHLVWRGAPALMRHSERASECAAGDTQVQTTRPATNLSVKLKRSKQYPNTPCMENMSISWGGFGIFGIHGVPGIG